MKERNEGSKEGAREERDLEREEGKREDNKASLGNVVHVEKARKGMTSGTEQLVHISSRVGDLKSLQTSTCSFIIVSILWVSAHHRQCLISLSI